MRHLLHLQLPLLGLVWLELCQRNMASGSSGLSASSSEALVPAGATEKAEVPLESDEPKQLFDEALQSGELQNVAQVRSQATPAKNSN